MSGRPAHVLAASPKPVGRQGIWDVIRRQRGLQFTLDGLHRATDIPRATIRDYVAGLIAAGYVAQEANIEGVGKIYTLARDVGTEAPRVTKDGSPVIQGAAREQMWRTMKMLRGDWNFRDLAVAASLEESPVADLDAKDYVQNLAKAGYLAIVKPGRSKQATRYRFIAQKNTGPKPPMVQRMSTVFDPNLGKIVWHPPVES